MVQWIGLFSVHSGQFPLVFHGQAISSHQGVGVSQKLFCKCGQLFAGEMAASLQCPGRLCCALPTGSARRDTLNLCHKILPASLGLLDNQVQMAAQLALKPIQEPLLEPGLLKLTGFPVRSHSMTDDRL
jgi:hypothetical protein